MERNKVYRAIGLMSGTSLDGVDAALIQTDGYGNVRSMGFASLSYDERVQQKIRGCFGLTDIEDSRVGEAARLLTFRHVEAIQKLVAEANIELEEVDVIGFHGQTIFHNPKKNISVQIGDAELLSKQTGVDVVSDFRSADIKAGGQGAPFLPLYHQALVRANNIPRPVAVLNIGGIANVTWIGEDDESMMAFDTGPGNALINDFIFERTGEEYDAGGRIARAGQIHREMVNSWMALPYFAYPLPKSLDRGEWDVSATDYLSTEDGAATLTAFTVEAIKQGGAFLPGKPIQWLVTGGGRHNDYLINSLQDGLDSPVKPVENVGWNGDAMEAEGFGYLAVRSLLGEPLSLPKTTGVPKPMTGGVLHKAA